MRVLFAVLLIAGILSAAVDGGTGNGGTDGKTKRDGDGWGNGGIFIEVSEAAAKAFGGDLRDSAGRLRSPALPDIVPYGYDVKTGNGIDGVTDGRKTEADSADKAEEAADKAFTEADIGLFAKMVWGEARGLSEEEMALTVRTALLRFDTGKYGKTLERVITAPEQFRGYDADNPVERGISALCKAELAKWAAGDVAPTHPEFAPESPYYYFNARDGHNYFRRKW